MAWIFQRNPDRFDIDDYLSRYSQRIYWRTNRYIKEISAGDPVFIWRTGKEGGAIAIGQVVETPTPAQGVKYPEAMGNELWSACDSMPHDGFKTGIQLSEVRLSISDGMVSRAAIKSDRILAESNIIKVPNGTVFRLSTDELAALMCLWGGSIGVYPTVGVVEGERQLRAHFTRERSSRLRRDKLVMFREEHSTLYCEICGFSASTFHPHPFTERAYEVHHKSPLAFAETPVRTTLDDLAVLCANCHRAVHSNSDVVKNFDKLAKLHAGKDKKPSQ